MSIDLYAKLAERVDIHDTHFATAINDMRQLFDDNNVSALLEVRGRKIDAISTKLDETARALDTLAKMVGGHDVRLDRIDGRLDRVESLLMRIAVKLGVEVDDD